MNIEEFEADDRLVRSYEYDDATVLVADFGPVDATVDVVDGTAVVVAERDGDAVQSEFDVPAGVSEAFIRNGVLTIEVSEE